MKAATIVPTPYLHLTKEDDYQMALAHLVGVNKVYTEYFMDRGREGKFIIMDNGVVEGDQRPLNELAEKAVRINANEVILPDKIYDTSATLRNSYNALEKFKTMGVPFRFMAVPQGNTPAQWYACAQEMLTWDIDTIGISKFTTPKFVNFQGNARKACFGMLISLGCQKNIHFLGCWNDPKEMWNLASCEQLDVPQARLIRGTDSIIAYAYARNNQYLTSQQKRLIKEIDFDASDANEALLLANIECWRDYCAGTLCELPEQSIPTT
jgi:hypothetical protein